MSLDFPASPTVNQKYPDPAIAGLPVYSWDGEKWNTIGGNAIGVDVGPAPPATATPLMDATPGVVGIAVKYAREDHKHPSDTTRLTDAPANGSMYARKDSAWAVVPGSTGVTEAPNDGKQYGRQSLAWSEVIQGITQAAADTRYVNTAGDTMSGALNVNAAVTATGDGTFAKVFVAGAPTANLELANKLYVDNKVASGGTGIPEAPTDGQQYGRQSSGWTVVTGGGGGGGTAVATTFSPSGNIAATNVQTAIQEVDTEKVAKAGDTLTGPLVHPAGTQTATTVNFGTAGTGLFGTSTQVNIATSGTQRVGISATAVTSTLPTSVPTGTAAATALNFGTAGTGLYGGAASVSVATSGTNRLTLSTTNLTSTVPVVLPADPAVALEAATKQYVDGKIVIAEAPTDGKLYGRQSSGWQAGVKLGGDTMTGLLLLSANPSAALGAATKQYVDARATIATAISPPAGLPDNSLWWETDTGGLYIRYNDGTSTAWVAATAATPPLGTVRYDIPQTLTVAQQVQTRQNIYAAPFDAMAYNGMQINGGMEVSQEFGSTLVTTFNKFAVDAFFTTYTGGPVVSYQQVTDAPPGFANSLKVSVTTAAPTIAAGAYALICQSIEGYRVSRLALGKATAQPFTIGFWCKTHRTGTYSVGVQNYAATRSYVTQFTQSVADTWEYKTVTIPGDTTGTWATNNAGSLVVQFPIGVGSTFLTPQNVWTAGNFFGATGMVNGTTAVTDTYQITGVVVLPGSEAPSATRSPYIMRPYDQEIASCQRYWAFIPVDNYFASTTASRFFGQSVTLPVIMRATPTCTLYGYTGSNLLQAPYIDGVSISSLFVMCQCNIATDALFRSQWTLDARI